jgi:predicted AAA+ superfamily ATPase
MTSEMNLKAWRDVITPHGDVASGKFKQAEFAADLAQVVSGKASSEYQDPVEFYKRTYLTAGMTRLLATALQRVSGEGTQPVIKIQTAFGGGKTHSMIAIYHLLSGKSSAESLEGIDEILKKAGTRKLPKASFAILVGSDLDPSRPKVVSKIRLNTLWGQMAFQIGGKEAYDIVKSADEKGVSPGSDTLIEILDNYGPCVILIDEMVTYVRNIYGVEGLPSGSFDSNISFIHSLTEAVKRSKSSLLVASIPESDIEIGGTAGKAVLARIDVIFNRLEEAWEPVQPKESFEIVRRRLFTEIQDPQARDMTCRAFSKLYSSSGSDFPSETKEESYYERMRAAYPIHPEVFDRLYDDWAAMEGFQRTRGVLRLMATAIHELWIQGDKSLLIMPSSLPLNAPRVKNELLRYLPDVWNNILDKDIDGDRSEPFKIDQENPRFGGRMASRRVARTIFLGSAPSVGGQRVRGIEDIRIRLGVVQPGEQVSLFDDALGKLLDRLTHLYSGNQRYWFDTQPGLRRVVTDRAGRLDFPTIKAEVEKRLKAVRERGDFHAIHVCPSSADVPDEQEARLVVLPIDATHKSGRADSEALHQANMFLDKRGDIPRQFKNMLVFLAPDLELAPGLDLDLRQYLAWSSVVEDADSLNLDGYQRRQAAQNKERTDESVDIRIKEAYCWLLVPTQEGSGPITWTIVKIPSGEESYVSNVVRKLRSAELLLTKWSPALLKMELDKWIWKDQANIGIQKLWEYMCKYPYLTRLKDSDVLMQTIRDGVTSPAKDYFAYATGIGNDGRYLGLRIGSDPGNVYLDSSSLLVKPDVALRQLQQENVVTSTGTSEQKETQSEEKKEQSIQTSLDVPLANARRFFGTVELDPTRLGRDAGKINEEVVQHLQSILDSKVEVTLEINAELPKGIPENIQRTIMENCKTLKFKNFSVEEK